MKEFALILVILGVSIVVVMGGLLIVLLIVRKRIAKASPANQPPSPAIASPNKLLDIVKERYARGEITREQYEQLRKDLS